VIAFCCLLLLAAITIPAAADERNKKTTITFTQPFEIPGQVLPAGTYVFKLLNSDSNRNIVMVYNAEENHCSGMILAINNYRLFPTGEAVLKFAERANNRPEALRAWFYSNDNWGQEFVYPKERATQLAETTNAPVLSTEAKPAETPEELIEAPVAAIAPENEPAEIAEATPLAEAPSASALAVEAVAEPAPAPEAAAPELPKTASPMPLMALIGASVLALGGLLRWLPKRVA
jgi:LPXTG-motif cell wall-anchored protein